jgi:hypothetical protein
VFAGDRGLWSADIFAVVKSRGADCVIRKHASFEIENHERRVIGEEDYIIRMKVSKEERLNHPELPEYVEVRVFHVVLYHHGKKYDLWLASTLLDPEKYPKEELALLYLQRWGVETSYEEVKVELHMGELRSKTFKGVKREIEACLAAYNYVRLMMLRAAKKAGVDPRDLSFVESVRIVVKTHQIARFAPPSQRKEILELMILQISVQRIKHRYGRTEPRAVKRKRDRYGYLTKSRAELRSVNAYACA